MSTSKHLFNLYKNQLTTNPLRTKMITSFSLFTMGDALCQRFERGRCSTLKSVEDGFKWDMGRSLRQGVIGGLFLSPYLHAFFTRVVS